MEIEYGLKLYIDREKVLRPHWEALLQSIKILPFCCACATAAASIRSRLKNLGLPIGSYDSLLAGSAIAYHMIMVTSNLLTLRTKSDILTEPKPRGEAFVKAPIFA